MSDMLKMDFVCPLYQADDVIDALIAGLKAQKGIDLRKVVFPITEEGDLSAVIKRIEAAGFEYFLVPRSEFSHSLTRERAITEYCESDVVVMMSQDVRLLSEHALFELASAVNEKSVYAYGRQVCPKRTIEYYVREKNYGAISHTVSLADVEKIGRAHV